MDPKKECKECGMFLTKETEHLFVLEYKIVNGERITYYKNLCWECRNKKKYRESENRLYINQLKSETPCKDCGIKYPPHVMHFDHLRDKEFNIGSGTKATYEKLLLEIAKCEIVCANCHAERTQKRRALKIQLKGVHKKKFVEEQKSNH